MLANQLRIDRTSFQRHDKYYKPKVEKYILKYIAYMPVSTSVININEDVVLTEPSNRHYSINKWRPEENDPLAHFADDNDFITIVNPLSIVNMNHTIALWKPLKNLGIKQSNTKYGCNTNTISNIFWG